MFKNIKKWGGRISYSLIDQAAYSGSNFILNILLVRWLPLEQYGFFSIVYTVFLVFSGFYTALILEPMSVLGASRPEEQSSGYTKFIIYLQTILLAFFVLVFAGISVPFALVNPVFMVSFMGISMFGPGILFFWLFRQYCYLNTQPGRACLGSLSYAAILLSCLVMLRNFNLLYLITIFMIFGIASVIPAIVLWPNFRALLKTVSWQSLVDSIKLNWSQQWNYGKWVVGTAVVYSLSTLFYPIMIGIILGSAETGIFRATQNFVLPLQQTLTAMSLLLVPILSKSLVMEGLQRFLRHFITVILIFLIVGLGYIGVLFLFGIDVFEIIYQNNIIETTIWIAPYWASFALISCMNTAFSIGLRVVQKPNVFFYANGLSAVFNLTMGIYLIRMWSLRGAMGSMVISSLLVLFIMVLYIIKRIRKEHSIGKNLILH